MYAPTKFSRSTNLRAVRGRVDLRHGEIVNAKIRLPACLRVFGEACRPSCRNLPSKCRSYLPIDCRTVPRARSANVPEITDSQTARGRRGIDTGASIRRNIRKGSATVVAIEETLLFVGAPQVILVHLRIDVAVSKDKIRPPVVVEVKKHCAPT